MGNVVVNWKGSGALRLNYAHAGMDPKEARSVGKITLIPGVNEIKHDDWAAVHEHPGVVKRLGDDSLEVISGEDTSKKDTPEYPLAEMKESKAVKLVKDNANKEILLKWRAHESSLDEPRSKVLSAIEKQLDDLDRPLGAKNEGDKED